MSKNKSTGISLQNVLDRAAELGLPIVEQSRFIKIAKNKKAVYIPLAKKGAKMAHVSGFRVDSAAVIAPPKKNGCVTGHIIFGADGWLEALFEALHRVAGDDLGTKFDFNGALFAK